MAHFSVLAINNMSLYYRVLSPGVREADGRLSSNTLARWMAGKYTSTHSHTPGHWTAIWNNPSTLYSTNRADYELTYIGTTYTPEALTAFLRFAPNHSNGEEWTTDEMKQTGEYAGVSAFDNPAAALEYGAIDLYFFVVFEGICLFPLPESQEGGFAVKFVRQILAPTPRVEFIEWLKSSPTLE